MYSDQEETLILSNYSYIASKYRLGIMSFGLIGNTLSFVLFSRLIFRDTSIATYYRALALVENIIICLLIVEDISLNIFDIDLKLTSTIYCKIYAYTLVGLSPIHGWILG